MKRTTITLTGLLLASLWLTGCTQVRQSFPGKDPGQVWTAMVAVANTPDYSDPDPAQRWQVKENRVWIDEETARIEIYRELDRVLNLASAKPRREHRTWEFQILYEGGDPPSATFVSRGWGVPMQAADEGDRYFADVWDMLGGPVEDAPAPQAEEAIPADDAEPAAEPDGKPIVDVEELEPTGG